MRTATSFDPRPMTITCPDVLLEPLQLRHSDDLFSAGEDEEIWRYLPAEPFVTLKDATSWIRKALQEQDEGRRLPFAIMDVASGRAIGSTSYLDINRKHRTLEIGWTWLTGAFQRTRVNTQCKRALLGHAFETLGAIRVQFKTDSRNLRSQRAIERIGGVREGTLRQTMILPCGYVRDTVCYSIIDQEWPAVRKRLDELASMAPKGSDVDS